MDQGDSFEMTLNRTYAAVMLLWLPALLSTTSAHNSAPQPEVTDPLKAVSVYSGKWHSEDESFATKFSKPSKESVDFVNDCSTQHDFFVCHQKASKASGTSSSMMVFLWNGKARLFETYVMDSGGGDPYHGHLIVDGDTYTWGSAAERESGTRWRTLNLFSGLDRIVYRVQFSTDEGKSWTTTREGKETRVSQ
jgi:hypothetical protein